MIKLGTQTAGIMLKTPDGDLSAISLLDTNPISPVSRAWYISFWPDNLVSAPTVTNATGNPATFTPPQVGEWYVVRLVRTLLVGTETEELPICIPDPTGTFALPPPGIPADTDPTKTIVNLNDDAKIVGWSGGARAGLPGLAGAVRAALTATVVPPASSIVPGTQSIVHFDRLEAVGRSIVEFGGVPDWNGSTGTDNSAALQNAHDNLPTTGGTIIIPNGRFKAAGLLTTKPIRIHFGASEITAGGISADIITCSNNIEILGQNQHVSKFSPTAGHDAIRFATFPAVVVGNATAKFQDIQVSGGRRGINTEGITNFNEGMLSVARCFFTNTTDVAIYLESSVYYGLIRSCNFYLCYGSAKVKDNTETKFWHNIHLPSNSGGPSLEFAGSHHVHVIGDEFLGFSPNLNPDILVYATADGANGILDVEGCKFGSENLYWAHSDRYNISNYNASNPQFSTFGVKISRCRFYGPQFFPCTSIGRLSNVVTATVTPLIGSGHGYRVGDKINATQIVGSQWNGIFTLTGVTATTLTWNQTGSDVSQANHGGYILNGSCAAIGMGSPARGFSVQECLFDGYSYGIDRFAATMTEGTTLRGASGACEWRGNTTRGPNGLAFRIFKDGQGPGQFS